MKRTPRKSAAQWAELVTEYSNSGESEQAFCARHAIKLVTLRKWRYHYNAQEKNAGVESNPRFVKLNVADTRAAHEAAVLCIGSDVRLECPASYDITTLAQLTLAVHHGR